MAPDSWHQISLLFVEGNKALRQTFDEQLGEKLLRLFLAKNEREGLQLFLEHKPDMVVTDITIPTRLEMIRRMKEVDPDVNVIVMSKYSIKQFFLEAINLGVSGYLVKPVDTRKLYSLIDELSGNIMMGKALEEKELNRRLAEEKLKKSLAEKELLLREVHHRVKNNLQIISSILKMQERQVDDPRLKTILGESQNRIRSMALIHENLYNNETLANIDFGNYVRSLSGNLSRSYSTGLDHIRFEFDLDESIFLPIDIGIPIGLIINELISNSFKHAFAGRHYGTIRISLSVTNGNDYVLRVGDNGVGMANALDLEKSGSLGMRIVSKLLQQIDGSYDLVLDAGTQYVIRFKG